jgi:hypothetical protein
MAMMQEKYPNAQFLCTGQEGQGIMPMGQMKSYIFLHQKD